jgi:hypothetical protein
MDKTKMTNLDGKPLAQAIEEANEELKKNVTMTEQDMVEDDADGGYYGDD